MTITMKIKKYSSSYLWLIIGLCFVSCSKDDNFDNDIISNDDNTISVSTGTIDGHDYVDLGLSVKWATCNIGASRPEDLGGYYGWADPTGEKTSSNVNDYPNSNPPSDIKMTKYDIAYNNWGSKWRMPTKDEFSELRSKCYYYYDIVNGIEGLRFRGSNGNSIFLPFGGYRDYKSSINQATWGNYWTSTLSSENIMAYRLAISNETSAYAQISTHLRCNGLSVRAVTDYSDNEDNTENDSENNDNENIDFEKPDIGFYDFTATKTSLKVQYKIYNKNEAKVTSAKIYYGTSYNPSLSKTATVSGTLITANISGLKAGTTYYVKCVATGKGGTTTTSTTKCITNF